MSTDLKINCLGNLQIRLGDKNISPFETDKAKALLVYLAIESDQKLQRSQLAGLLWPDETEERALHNLRQTLSSLRKTLNNTTSNSELLIADRKTIELAPDIKIHVDSLEFKKLFQAALQHYQEQSGRGLIHIRFLKRSLDLVQGEFLANFSISKSILFEEWVSFQREELNLMAVRGFNLLAVYHELRGENHHAIEYVAKIVELCPWDESAQNRLIRLLAVAGQWTAAKMQFATMKRYLQNELSVSPAQASIQLYDQVCLAAEGSTTIEAEHKPKPSQLPVSHAAFIGREKEQDEVMTWLTKPQTRLVTLTGLGGIGKTHLALQIAGQFAGIFQNGVYFVPLISVKDANQLIPQIADAIGFVFTGQAPNEKQLLEHLRKKKSLLVLDNFEHLLNSEKCMQFLDALLNTSRHLKLLVTSRERLNLVQEQVYLLSGLPYPQSDDISTSHIQTYESIELFLHRTTQKLPQFTLNEHNALSIIRICHILEGLPLGVELAAATVCEQNCNQIDETYVNNLGALATQMNNFPLRHRNLNAAFELSWKLLTPPLKACLYKLSFFLDSFSRHAALQIAGAATYELTTLVSKSLLRIDENGRYSMHKAIRQFTSGKTLPDIDPDLLMEKHAAYYTEFLHSLTNDLLKDGQTKALNAISIEFGNLSLCCNWVIEHCRADLIRKSMDSLYHYYSIRSQFEEGISWFRRSIAKLSQDCNDELTLGMLLWRLGALAYTIREDELIFNSLNKSEEILSKLDAQEELAFCNIFQGWAYQREKDFSQSQKYADLALQYFLSQHNDLGLTQVYLLIGSIENWQGNFPPARQAFEKAYYHCKKTNNLRNLSSVINRLADLYCYQGKYDEGIELYQEALGYNKQLGDRYHQAMSLNNLGTIHHIQANYDMAEQYYQQSLAITREIDDLDGTALALNNLGELATWQQEYQAAMAYSQEALEIAQKLDEPWTIVVCLNALGEICFGLNEYDKSKSYSLQALKLAIQINGLHLVTRVLVNLGKIYQQTENKALAIEIWKACLLHSATDQGDREKAQNWLAELDIVVSEENDDRWMDELLSNHLLANDLAHSD